EHGHGVAAEINRLHPRALGDLGVERRVDAAGEEVGLVTKQLPERLALAVHGNRLLLLGVRGERRGPRQFEQPLGTTPAVMGGLQLVGAAWTAGGPALDTAQALKTESNLGATAASIAHVNLLL